MKKNHIHKDHKLRDSEEDFLRQLGVPEGRSKNEIWESLNNQLDKVQAEKKKDHFSWMNYAALVLLIMGSVMFMRFYSVQNNCPKGEHLSHILPDGSTVTLNADSYIKYNKYWWTFGRQLHLEGEAFFEVVKGSSFRVDSEKGNATVLGTSFNIITRDGGYAVYCATGSVQVNSASEEVVLTSSMMASLNEKGELEVEDNVSAEKIISWRNNKFIFSATPLPLVLKEVERQYAINILIDINRPEKLIYSGYFSRSKSAEKTLGLICQGIGIKFVKQNNRTYTVSQFK